MKRRIAEPGDTIVLTRENPDPRPPGYFLGKEFKVVECPMVFKGHPEESSAAWIKEADRESVTYYYFPEEYQIVGQSTK